MRTVEKVKEQKEKVDNLMAELGREYPHVHCVYREDVEMFIKDFPVQTVHYLYDYLLSRGLVEVEE